MQDKDFEEKTIKDTNIMKDKVKPDNPYGNNYKIELENLRKRNSEKASIVKNKIDKLISRIQSLTK